jgi:hypothetical protein
MIECRFSLTGEPMSTFEIQGLKVPAFSGSGPHVNRALSPCLMALGPIPRGRYWVFDRQSGGLTGPLRDLFTGRSDWFALYGIDQKIDDEVFCGQVKRGRFRLHSKGMLGRSEGCVVIEQRSDFMTIRSILRRLPPQAVPGSPLKAYAVLSVL